MSAKIHCHRNSARNKGVECGHGGGIDGVSAGDGGVRGGEVLGLWSRSTTNWNDPFDQSKWNRPEMIIATSGERSIDRNARGCSSP